MNVVPLVWDDSANFANSACMLWHSSSKACRIDSSVVAILISNVSTRSVIFSGIGDPDSLALSVWSVRLDQWYNPEFYETKCMIVEWKWLSLKLYNGGKYRKRRINQTSCNSWTKAKLLSQREFSPSCFLTNILNAYSFPSLFFYNRELPKFQGIPQLTIIPTASTTF